MAKLHCILVVFMVFAVNQLFGQKSIDRLVRQDRAQTERIIEESHSTTTYLHSVFSENALVDNANRNLMDLTISKIYYVYTQYRRHSSFDQHKLDKERFLKLETLIPGITSDPFVEWELIEQTGCNDFTEGPEYFHGFILIHRPVLSEKERIKEVLRLTEYMNQPGDQFAEEKLDFVTDQLKTKEEEKAEPLPQPDAPAYFREGDYELYRYLQESLSGSPEITLHRDDEWVKTKFNVDSFGKVSDVIFDGEYPTYIKEKVGGALLGMTGWAPAVTKEIPVQSEVNMDIRVSYSRSVNGMFQRDGNRPTFSAKELPAQSKEDSVLQGNKNLQTVMLKQSSVYRGLNELPEDEKFSLVMDVTGSMSSHIAAMKYWIFQNPEKFEFTSYTFFNDGNGKPTKQKKIGSTGGVYLTREEDKVATLIQQTMLLGGGGERSESDVEAMLYAQNHDTISNSILLIGDNYSEIRDLSILKKIKRKVHVLICAAPEALREDYMTIVKRTGGYLIHNGNILSFDSVGKGDRIRIANTIYMYNGKEFKVKEVMEGHPSPKGYSDGLQVKKVRAPE